MYINKPSATNIEATDRVNLLHSTIQGPRHVFESGVAIKCFEPRSGEKYFLGPSRGAGGMLPRKF